MTPFAFVLSTYRLPLRASSNIEVPLSSALQAFQAMGLGLGPDGAAGGPLPSSTSIIPGGVTPHGAQGGDTPPESSSSKVAAEASEVAQDEISPWLGEPGSLGKYSLDTQDPTSRFSVSVSKALAGCLRHGHQPTVSATSAGCNSRRFAGDRT